MMDNKPIVFLDVDGVLNNPKTWGKHIPNMADALGLTVRDVDHAIMMITRAQGK